ncbi:MAG: hypothetical protein K2O05_00035, partial [Anaeroplasmataceae bacterium]|nr:hypothetical protein [Anaeroplasmataceae bacterium]
TLNNVIVIVEGIEEKQSIGFNHATIKEEVIFDEIISNDINEQKNFNAIYTQALSRLHYEISFDFDINSSNKRKVNHYLYEFTKNHKNGKYEIKKEDIIDI